MMTSSDFPTMLPNEEFVDEEMMMNADETLPQTEERSGVCQDEETEGSLVCGDDQLPNAETYKAMMGYRKESGKKSTGVLKKKIIHKFAKKMSATPIDMTDSPDGSVAGGKEPRTRGVDPPEQCGWGDLKLSPSGETFMDDYHEDENDGHCQNSVLPSKQDSSNRSWWKCCTLLTMGPLLVIFSLGVIALTSHMHRWSMDHNRGSDVHTGEFVKGMTKEYLRVRHYLLHVGQLPYNRTYDNGDDDYDPNSTEPQPIVQPMVLLDETSPQYLAAQWLAHGDGSLRSVLPPTTNQKEYNQRYAMATIYFALGGDQWTRNYNFMSSGHICTWKEEYSLQAIAEAATGESDPKLADLLKIHGGNWQYMDGSLSDRTVIHGVHDCVRDAEGNLYPRALYLPHNNLHGSIPDEIGILNELELLNIEFNGMVTGKLTDHLQELQYLRHLGLQFCNHEGHLPMWLPNLSQLEFLGLGSNRFDGNVPEDIALLTNLKLLGLDNNLVRGDLGMLAPLINLESLYLQGTFMEGSIESMYMELWPKLVELDVSSCQLSGTVPADFWDMVYPNLKVLDLHGNNFVGPIPAPPPNNAISGQPWELEYLALNHNQFTGMIPDVMSHFGKLKHLDISENELSFGLPPTLAELTDLEYFIAGNNYQFEQAEFPMFLIELTELRELSIGGTNLVGKIPPSLLGYLSNLEILDLHNNGLSGTVPTDIASLTNLRNLVLKNNHLTGELPTFLANLNGLQVLLVEQNQFHGSADAICDAGRIPTFVADCGGEAASVEDTTSTQDGGPGDWVVDNSAKQTGHGTRRTTSTKDGEVGDLIGGGMFIPPVQGGWIENNEDNSTSTKDGEVGDLIGGGNFPPSDQGGWIENNEDNSTSTKDGEVGGGLIGGGNFPPAGHEDSVGNTIDNTPSTTRDGGSAGDLVGGNDFPPFEPTGMVTCSCCSMCCNVGDYSCHNWVRKGNGDTIWKYGYKKKRYSYHL